MPCIDLNCDMGESFGAWTMGADAEVMPWISSANIACGFHAGDPLTQHATATAAIRAGVAVGAHVGLPDLAGFGRRAMAVRADEVYTMTVAQLGTMIAMARACGGRCGHVKAHGALYHMLERQAELSEAVVEAVRDVDSSLRLVGFAGGQLLELARHAGLDVAGEAFVDRGYGADGRLLPRGTPGAVLDEPAAIARQAVALATQRRVQASDGSVLAVDASTLCIHGDRANAVAVARAVHQALVDAGVEIHAPGSG